MVIVLEVVPMGAPILPSVNGEVEVIKFGSSREEDDATLAASAAGGGGGGGYRLGWNGSARPAFPSAVAGEENDDGGGGSERNGFFGRSSPPSTSSRPRIKNAGSADSFPYVTRRWKGLLMADGVVVCEPAVTVVASEREETEGAKKEEDEGGEEPGGPNVGDTSISEGPENARLVVEDTGSAVPRRFFEERKGSTGAGSCERETSGTSFSSSSSSPFFFFSFPFDALDTEEVEEDVVDRSEEATSCIPFSSPFPSRLAEEGEEACPFPAPPPRRRVRVFRARRASCSPRRFRRIPSSCPTIIISYPRALQASRVSAGTERAERGIDAPRKVDDFSSINDEGDVVGPFSVFSLSSDRCWPLEREGEINTPSSTLEEMGAPSLVEAIRLQHRGGESFDDRLRSSSPPRCGAPFLACPSRSSSSDEEEEEPNEAASVSLLGFFPSLPSISVKKTCKNGDVVDGVVPPPSSLFCSSPLQLPIPNRGIPGC